MGILSDTTKLNLKAAGGNAAAFKLNSMYIHESCTKNTDGKCTGVPLGKIRIGRFYRLLYDDPSLFIKHSHVFLADAKKFSNKVVLLCANMNFLKLEQRIALFDSTITQKDIQNDSDLPADFAGTYAKLSESGHEWALMEYDASKIIAAYEIHMSIVDRFLWANPLEVKYDPSKLEQIWSKKLETRKKRHEQLEKTTIDQLFEASDEFKEKFSELAKRATRLSKKPK